MPRHYDLLRKLHNGIQTPYIDDGTPVDGSRARNGRFGTPSARRASLRAPTVAGYAASVRATKNYRFWSTTASNHIWRRLSSHDSFTRAGSDPLSRMHADDAPRRSRPAISSS